MHPYRTLAAFALAGFCVTTTHAQSYSFYRMAGMPPPRGSADGVGTLSRFNTPISVATDAAGNVYVADVENHTIRKVTRTGVVTTFAGSPGVRGVNDGTGGAARFDEPWGIAFDSSGNLFVADSKNHIIRKITPAGTVTTFAGEPGVSGTSDGTGRSAHFNMPSGVAVDAEGSVFVADRINRTIRKITASGVVSTFAAKSGVAGSLDGVGTNARFAGLSQLTIDSTGNLYLGDTMAHTIRKITPAGLVSTIAGTVLVRGHADGSAAAATFDGPWGLCVDKTGTLYIADTYNETIRKITPEGVTSVFAGTTSVMGNQNGTGTSARFSRPMAVTIDASGNLFVADAQNHSIRKITSEGLTSLLAGAGGNYGSADGPADSAQFYMPHSVAIASTVHCS